MRARIIRWLLDALGYPTRKLTSGPSMLAVVVKGAVVFTTTQAPHLARAKCRELRANGDDARLVLYRAFREEEP